MKKAICWILLFSYVTVILKPLTPYVKDAAAHLFNYSHHMATVHYEHGKMHIHRELAANEKTNEPTKEIPASKKIDTEKDYIILKEKQDFISSDRPCFLYRYTGGLFFTYLAAEYPPPKA